jgi:NAD(P)H-flavin reductase
VKAFIGIERVGLLRYRERGLPRPAEPGDTGEASAGRGREAHLYVDDLKQAGVGRRNIFLSHDRPCDVRGLVPGGNHLRGFVSDLYRRHLSCRPPGVPAVAFACGPTPMMKAVADVANAHGVRLYVLMEKRMACGIGVCLSCVCRTTTGHAGYSRVCREGPVFDANELVWS